MRIEQPDRPARRGAKCTGGGHRARAPALVLVAAALASGCAVHYYDPETSTEHVWGIGHVRFKAAAAHEDVKAVVRGVRSVGLGLGQSEDGGYVMLGYRDARSIEVVPDDAAVRLEWPTSDFFDVRVGSAFPVRLLRETGGGPAPE